MALAVRAAMPQRHRHRPQRPARRGIAVTRHYTGYAAHNHPPRTPSFSTPVPNSNGPAPPIGGAMKMLGFVRNGCTMRMRGGWASTFAPAADGRALPANPGSVSSRNAVRCPAKAAMRILHVIAGAPTGGAETFCFDTIAAVAELGIEQKVLCRPHPQALARLDERAVPYEPLSFTPAARLIRGPAAIRPEAASWGADLF